MSGEDGFDLSGSGARPLEADDPRRIGPIPLVGRLGSGGMGQVFLGVHEGRYAAVKQVLPSVISEDADFLRRFGHELDNLSRLPVEATAPLLASDRTARPPWFATAYVPGLTLREALDVHGGPLPADSLWLLLREAASGLAAVHARKMVHRDLKPSNVMLTLDGLTLIDFGIARADEQTTLTLTGMMVGTPAYMSPEQASGARPLTGATDVFALGSLVAYAASGRPPFGDESRNGVLYRIVHEEPDLEPVRARDPELAEVVAACLDKDPESRPTAAELVERAERHGPFAPPLWPPAVTERLDERAAFATTVPSADRLGIPEPADTLEEPGAEGEADATAEPDAAAERDVAAKPDEPGDGKPAKAEPAPRPDRGERLRTRILFAVIPVVVVTGTTLAIQLLPYTFSSGDRAGSTPTASVSASSLPMPSTTGASASKTAKPAKSSSSPPDKGKGAGASPAAAGDAQDGSDGSTGSGGSGGSGGSSGSGSSDGSGGTSTGAVTNPASGTYRFKNGDTGKCLTQVYGAAGTGDCADSTAYWTVKSSSAGGFELVNQQTGQCLSANMLGQATFVGDCDQASPRLWRTGSGSTLRSVSNGGCLDVGSGGGAGVHTPSCESGKASQRWTKV
ncbi:serine/threonine-protein kinase [Streptomyces jeddahensis]|uniref:serine/threonine-protein kinase n=1 Tax=Streptomyces jeddahensis TaxID=1716141 RepID=UPI0008327D2B|nr:serine/threonine protein kinase [Streptomyces jeddahensis]